MNVRNSLSVEFLDAVFLRRHKEELLARVLQESLLDNDYGLKALSLLLRYISTEVFAFDVMSSLILF